MAEKNGKKVARKGTSIETVEEFAEALKFLVDVNAGESVAQPTQTDGVLAPATEKKEEGLTFQYTAVVGGKETVFTFRMPNESASSINVTSGKKFVEKANALIESARLVRQQKLFGNIDVQELAKHYPFTPYLYQIENVKTMLNRFEGNGVFGDQVGLGKTVQALMTAHAMFASGAIRNALIVVPKNTKEGWIEEMKSKFPDVFIPDDCGSDVEEETEGENSEEAKRKKTKGKEVKNEEKKSPTFLDVLHQIKKDNDSKKTGNRIYVVTEGMLAANLESILRVEKAGLYDKAMSGVLTEEETRIFAKIKKELENVSTGKNVEKVLKSFGWRADAWYPYENIEGRENEAFFLYAMSYAKYEKLTEILRECSKKLSRDAERYDNARNTKDTFDKWIIEIEMEFSEMKLHADVPQEERIYLQLLAKDSARLVDLLIVDEVHSFYGKSNDDTGREDYDEEKIHSAVDLLAKIGKKYCVLMSATPVRTCLDNVFDLIYIADRARVGEDRVSGLDYFHNTVCQLPKSVKGFLLGEMIYNPTSRKNFFGMVNNFFTRKRIHDVEEQMRGDKEKRYSELMKKEGGIPKIIREIENDLYDNCVLLYQQTGLKRATAEMDAEDTISAWMEGRLHDCELTADKREQLEVLKAGVDLTLMGVASKGNDSEKRKMAHGKIDWSRRKKEGIGLIVDDMPRGYQPFADEPMEDGWLKKLFYEVEEAICCTSSDSSRVSVVADGGATLGDTKKIDVYKATLRSDATLVYVSRATYEDEDIRRKLARFIEDKYKGARKVFFAESSSKKKEIPTIGKENYNQMSLLHQGYQAGVNLQRYRTLVFAQLDHKGQRLLEPVDIEQWVGRIHRTGQVKNCHVITLLKTYMIHDTKNPDLEFLKWYYEILSDPEGLDLYGENTPDVAFLQPVVVDRLRWFFATKARNAFLLARKNAKLEKKPIDAEWTLDEYSFSELLEVCYYIDKVYENGGASMKTAVRDMLRALCKLEGFAAKSAQGENR